MTHRLASRRVSSSRRPLVQVFAIFGLATFIAIADRSDASAQFRSRMSGGDSRDAAGSFADRTGGGSTNDSRYRSPSDPPPRKLQVVLREGTFIGPVRGRFVNRGQRWHFMADSTADDSAAGDGESGRSELIEVGGAREIVITQNTLLERSREQQQRVIEAADVSAIGRATQPSGHSPRSTSSHLPESIIVVENLMLGRVADAIEDDPQDDYWTITGRVTEFQDENRLIVLTTYRAPSKTQPRP